MHLDQIWGPEVTLSVWVTSVGPLGPNMGPALGQKSSKPGAREPVRSALHLFWHTKLRTAQRTVVLNNLRAQGFSSAAPAVSFCGLLLGFFSPLLSGLLLCGALTRRPARGVGGSYSLKTK